LTTDYADSLKTLFSGQWTAANLTNAFTPSFSIEWHRESWNVTRLVMIRELMAPRTVEDCSNAFHRIDAVYQIDCWANDRTDVMEMRTEMDRIVNANNNNPATGLCFMVQRRWTDNSFLERELYRMTLELLVIYYEAA